MAPSITYWNRLEPRARTRSLQRSLAAEVRDPLWLLCRQRQLGEFIGEDSGSPAYVSVDGNRGRVIGHRAGAETSNPLLPYSGPAERHLQQEPLDPTDVSVQIELGQQLERMLRTANVHPIDIASTRASFPLQPPPQPHSPSLERMMAVHAGLVVNGLQIFIQVSNNMFESTAILDPMGVETVVADFAASVAERFGDAIAASTQSQDPAGWQHDALDYDAGLIAIAPSGARVELRADPTANGDLDPSSFVVRPTVGSADYTEYFGVTRLPAQVRFRGMPNARFWTFEREEMPVGQIDADRRDLSRMMLLDFMLVHGNDWFTIPIETPVGSITQLYTVMVRDVFGSDTVIPAAAQVASTNGSTWSMYTLTDERSGRAITDWLFVPPTAGNCAQRGAPIEEVRFFRDEMANMAWGVEHTVPDGAGGTWSGAQRATASRPPLPPPPRTPDEAVPLGYRVQSEVPSNWVPFVPVRTGTGPDVVFKRGSFADPAHGSGDPAGRIVLHAATPQTPLTVREEAIPRTGVRVQRVPMRARWSDGGTHVWIQRQRMSGHGEGSSALQYDRAVTRASPETPPSP